MDSCGLLNYVLCFSFVLVCILNGSEASTTVPPRIHCYTCKSWEDDRCNDPYNKKSITPDYCPGSCYKRVIEDAPETLNTGVERGCLDKRQQESTCVTYTDLLQRTGTECVCGEDRCNGVLAGKSSRGVVILTCAVALFWILLLQL